MSVGVTRCVACEFFRQHISLHADNKNSPCTSTAHMPRVFGEKLTLYGMTQLARHALDCRQHLARLSPENDESAEIRPLSKSISSLRCAMRRAMATRPCRTKPVWALGERVGAAHRMRVNGTKEAVTVSTLAITVLTRLWHAPCGKRSAVYIEIATLPRVSGRIPARQRQ